ncbi:polysaccharide biosynthesis/export family protein [Paracraurococcus lichenis]|uniref:Polysaccharide biosynthesis/export family protein n=1 Tax=Paracraurococcus lichenis TaxID=3064888 RepID=A0ABT9DU13_9PROT|nr:polysaccharide biosynthesis/export family protein [Paracraurococcus sp. LOR1-02]MDO9707384.1 polysaccharide biosynthesis/export family protein [Paracraurococcus sp. LOR1-02]
MRPRFSTVLVAVALAGGGASAQTPMQVLQQRAAQSVIPSAPNQGVVQALQSLVGQDRVVSRAGTETASEGGPVAIGPLGDGSRAAGATAVFGASLFTREATAVSDAPNPNYQLVPGDRVSVRVWGAVEAEVVGQVDPSGMLFLPNIGPIRVAGTRAGDLQKVVESEVKKVYTDQVQVYAVLLSTNRIGVFVTGFVRTPGRFAGSAADSVVDFLVRAGGVDPGRGSYREIALQRGGHTVTTIDLYRFLLEGQLPRLRLQEGDTLVVAKQRAVVGADGAVRNNYLFEVPGRAMTGRELLDYARPLPSATNAVVKGTRNGQPYSRYATLAELPTLSLQDQDTVTFITDSPARTVRVTVEGSRIGPSVLVADRDAQLCQVLDHVAVDPLLADTRSVFLLRPSVAQQQRRAIDEALDRLERQLFLAVSPTTGVAAIRSSEANLVSSYIQRARRTQPEGRLVVVDGNGHCSPLRLEDGDVIVIPEKSQTVLVAGEVTAPRAVVWKPEMRLADYVKAAGGYAPRGSDSSLMIRRASGELLLDPQEVPKPGDELIVLPRLDPKLFQIGSDLLGLIYQIAVATRVFL